MDAYCFHNIIEFKIYKSKQKLGAVYIEVHPLKTDKEPLPQMSHVPFSQFHLHPLAFSNIQSPKFSITELPRMRFYLVRDLSNT